MKKKILAITKRAAIILSVTVILLEIGLRIFGYGVFKLPQFSFISDPNRHVTPDPKLGIHLTPGDFKVTLNHHLKYTATHLKNGQRTCGGTENKSSEQTTIAFYGCSFTYGTGVNDWETYPYLVQQKFPKLNIENHAVPGYGQAQMLLRIEKEINSVQKPDAIILNYLSFHNERNTMNALYRQRIRIGFENTKRDDLGITKFAFNYPYGIMDNETLRIDQVSIDEITSTLPLIRYSAIMNSLQNFCDAQNVDPLEDERVTTAIIERIHEMCKKKDVELILSIMTDDEVTRRLIAHCKDHSIDTIDLTIDLTQKGFTNAPYDSHPSAKAHKMYAEKLTPYFKQLPNKL